MDNIRTINIMGTERNYMPAVMCMRGSGKRVLDMATVNTFLSMEPSRWPNIKITKSRGTGDLSGLMTICTEDSTKETHFTVKDCSDGLQERHTKVIFLMEISTGKES